MYIQCTCWNVLCSQPHFTTTSTQPINCSWSITAYTTQAPTVVSCIHILLKSVFRVQHGIYKYIHVYTMYIQCTCWNVLCSQPHFTSKQVLSALLRRRVSAPRCRRCSESALFFILVFAMKSCCDSGEISINIYL